MRRTLLLALVGLCVLACSKPKAPKPPASLQAAYDEMLKTAEGQGNLGFSAEKLSKELLAWENAPDVPIMMKADLHRVGMEVAVFGAKYEMGGPSAQAEWQAVKGKLDRVLVGKAPEPGPRWQLDMPEPVKQAVKAVDKAVAGSDAQALGSALGQLQGAMSDWAPKVPGQRGIDLMTAVDRDLDAMRFSQIEQVRAQWPSFKKRLKLDVP